MRATRYRGFREGNSGSTSMLFGLMLIPITLTLGAALDYSRAAKAKSTLQQMTDAAVLAVTRELKDGAAPGRAKNRAANLLMADARLADVSVVGWDFSAGRMAICLTTSADVPAMVMQIASVSVIKVSAHACADIGNGSQEFEIALVPDNSGSMSESAGGVSKMRALRTAATNFVTTMFDRSSNKVKMSIVPFAGLVIPVDPGVAANRALPWIDVNAESSQHWLTFVSKADAAANGFNSRFDVFDRLQAREPDWRFGGCYEPQPYPMNVTETVPRRDNPDTLFVPYFAPDEADGSFGNSYLDDNGGDCGTTVRGDWNKVTRACKYKGDPNGSRARGPNGLCTDADTQTITQLTRNESALKSKIERLSAGGDTNLHEGLMWGWRSISPNAPFSAGAAYDAPQVKKILVLMTDGYNNWSSNPKSPGGSTYAALGYYSYNGQQNLRLPDGSRGNGVDYRTALKGAANSSTNFKPESRLAQDELTAQSCENAKQAGIELYTIGFSVASAPIDTAGINLLKTCATNPDHYFLATSAGEIDGVFAKIAGKMAKVRLTQ